MPYQNNIPLATDRLNDSQAAILGNFQQLAVDFAVNHSGYGTANAGKHDKVVFPNLAAQPVVAFLPTELGMYNFTNPTTGVPEIYVRRGAALTGFSITGNQFTPKLFNVTTNSWTSLSSGLVIKFGAVRSLGNGVIDLNTVGPAFTQTPYVTVSMNETGVDVDLCSSHIHH